MGTKKREQIQRGEKNESQRRHFDQRCLERLGFRLTVEDKRNLRRAISDERIARILQVEFIAKESNRVSHWRVKIDGNRYIVVYDCLRKNLVTIWEIEGYVEFSAPTDYRETTSLQTLLAPFVSVGGDADRDL